MRVKDIYLAGGCFWGVQKYFDLIDGVIGTEVGYANGKTKKPNYQNVCNGSGHAETVHVIYNPDIIKLNRLLDYYYDIVDPTSFHKQGMDKGIQYRTGIYYTDKKDVELIVNSLEQLQQKYLKPIVIEVEKLKSKVDKQENSNQSLSMQVDELASLSNIQDIAKSYGLSYNNDNIIVINN